MATASSRQSNAPSPSSFSAIFPRTPPKSGSFGGSRGLMSMAGLPRVDRLVSKFSSIASGDHLTAGSKCWVRERDGLVCAGSMVSSPQRNGMCIVKVDDRSSGELKAECIQVHRSQLTAHDSGTMTHIHTVSSADVSVGTRCLLMPSTKGPEGEPEELFPTTTPCVVLSQPNKEGRCVVKLERGYMGGASRACRLVHTAQLEVLTDSMVGGLFKACAANIEEDEMDDDSYYDGKLANGGDECKEAVDAVPKVVYADEGDPDYAPYYKMLKVGTPPPAVAQKMVKDGRDPARIRATEGFSFGAAAAPPPTVNLNAALLKRPPKRRTTVKTLPLDFHSAGTGSIWGEVAALNGITVHQKELEHLFVKATTKAAVEKEKKTTISSEARLVLINPKRSTNIAIALAGAKLGSWSPKRLRAAIRRLDCSGLDPVQILALEASTPTHEESANLLSGGGGKKQTLKTRDSYEAYAEGERFMLRVSMRVDRYAERVSVLLFRATLEERATALESQLCSLETCCSEIVSSERLKKLLTYVLRLSSELNAAKKLEFSSSSPVHKEQDHDAAVVDDASHSAFRLHSLNRLAEMKSFDHRTSALGYLASLMAQNDDLATLNFIYELPSIHAAKRVSLNQSAAELRSLKRGAVELLEMTVGGRRHREEEAGVLSEDDEDGDADEAAAASLAAFGEKASTALQGLEAKLEGATLAFDSMIEYFGEESQTPNDFFTIFIAFSAKAAEALERHKRENRLSKQLKDDASTTQDARQRIEEKLRRRATTDTSASLPPKPPPRRQQQRRRTPKSSSFGALELLIAKRNGNDAPNTDQPTAADDDDDDDYIEGLDEVRPPPPVTPTLDRRGRSASSPAAVALEAMLQKREDDEQAALEESMPLILDPTSPKSPYSPPSGRRRYSLLAATATTAGEHRLLAALEEEEPGFFQRPPEIKTSNLVSSTSSSVTPTPPSKDPAKPALDTKSPISDDSDWGDDDDLADIRSMSLY